MRHLLLCREYPPGPAGGIGTYAEHVARLLAENGETVHVVAPARPGANDHDERLDGRLVVHRVPSGGPNQRAVRALRRSAFPPQAFAWQAARLAERLVEQEAIDLIEAEDFQAPLYFFQLRRALGSGPRRLPPCVVHLHSLTETLVEHGDGDLAELPTRTAKRLEDYSVVAADGLLCPSRYYAREVESRYGLEPGSVEVIPYPIGDTPVEAREPAVWDSGSICYVGRLEARKGILEWIGAAVTVASRHADLVFEFVGTIHDLRGEPGDEFLDRRVPRGLRHRFRFHGRRERAMIREVLARSRLAAIPSRWDNLPYAGIEAMASGLPVIACRESGMPELVEHDRTGWLAEPGTAGLEAALERALAKPGPGLAEMGRAAAAVVRRHCDESTVLTRHLAWRSRLVDAGARRSQHLPTNLPDPAATSRRASRSPAHAAAGAGIAVVVIARPGPRDVESCLASLAAQTQTPASVVVVAPETPPAEQEGGNPRCVAPSTRRVICPPDSSAALVGLEAALDSAPAPRGIVFLESCDRMAPGYIATCDAILARSPEVGVVSCWTERRGAARGTHVAPCPAFPDQWLSNDAGPCSALRITALDRAAFDPELPGVLQLWALVNAAMAAGWIAITVPEILARHTVTESELAALRSTRLRRRVLQGNAKRLARDAEQILLLASSPTGLLRDDGWTPADRLAIAGLVLRDPASPAVWSWRRIRRRLRRRLREARPLADGRDSAP